MAAVLREKISFWNCQLSDCAGARTSISHSLSLHEGHLPANELPTRMTKLDLLSGNGETRGETGLQYKVQGEVWLCSLLHEMFTHSHLEVLAMRIQGPHSFIRTVYAHIPAYDNLYTVYDLSFRICT